VLLLDASIWVAAKDADDPYFESALRLVRDPRVAVAALDLTLYEAANVVGGRWRQPDAARDLCRTIVARCQDRLVAVGSRLIDLAIEAADEHGLTAYDAAYVAAARDNGWTLVSADVADLVSRGLAVTPDAADYPLSG
jgi:predicted nucleic acid-binding protein